VPATITVYGGAGTIGGNKILLEDQDTSVMFDFGTSFDARFKYFEQFLVPRSRAGLLDLIHMGLLPPLRGIYRSDLDNSGGRILERAQRYPHYRDCRLDAVLLSHAHIDHCGCILVPRPLRLDLGYGYDGIPLQGDPGLRCLSVRGRDVLRGTEGPGRRGDCRCCSAQGCTFHKTAVLPDRCRAS
jgi:mRNA degradation ribonuclease J1/J2